jgi:hypothetical protein
VLAEPSYSTRSLSLLLSYPFRGQNWALRGSGIILLLSILTVVFQPLSTVIEMGIALQVARRLLSGRAAPEMPGWGPWAEVLRDGLRWYIANLVYNLPALAVMVVAGAMVVSRYGLPHWGVPYPGLARGWPILALGLVLAFPLAVIGGWLANTAAIHLARRDSLAAAFQVGGWGRVMAANLGGFLRALLFMLLVGLGLTLAQLLLSIPAAALVVLPVILSAAFSLYQRLVSVAAYALAYREGERNSA